MKLYYSKQNQRYEVSQWTPEGRKLIDHDKDLWELGVRQGFFGEDDEEINNFNGLSKKITANEQQLITTN